uniref:Ig-like domain-containing protein n=1 Tax=Amazona collaria TaxID=241587 RepID=A0A8B9F419_9PSIT
GEESRLLFGQARTQPRQVNGVLGGAVLLSPALPPNRTVKEVEWSFSAGTGATIQVAELARGGFERPDPKDRFKDRLEAFNQTGLRISALQRGDSGVYGARVKLHPAMVEDQFFNLSIYESVPSPRTRSQLLASTLEWCNVTLQCQGSGKGAVNVTWKQDNIEWERSSERHQLSPDGTTLRLWLPPAATNGTLACTVSNPADRRVVLFDLGAICQAGGEPRAPRSGRDRSGSRSPPPPPLSAGLCPGRGWGGEGTGAWAGHTGSMGTMGDMGTMGVPATLESWEHTGGCGHTGVPV